MPARRPPRKQARENQRTHTWAGTPEDGVRCDYCEATPHSPAGTNRCPADMPEPNTLRFPNDRTG